MKVGQPCDKNLWGDDSIGYSAGPIAEIDATDLEESAYDLDVVRKIAMHLDRGSSIIITYKDGMVKLFNTRRFRKNAFLCAERLHNAKNISTILVQTGIYLEDKDSVVLVERQKRD